MSDATFGTYRDNGDGTWSVSVPVIISGNERDVRLFLAKQALRYTEPVKVDTVSKVYLMHFHPMFRRQVDEGERSVQTLKNYESTWKNVVCPTWADALVDDIRPIDIQRWLDTLPLNRAKKGLVLLSGILDIAVRYGMCDANPTHEKYAMPSKKTVERADKTTWTLADVEGFCRSLRGTAIEPYAILLGMGGCRVGEALGVTASDVSAYHTAHGTVAIAHVDKQMRNDGVVSDLLKNKWSYRDVIVPGEMGARLLELAERGFAPMKQKELLRDWPDDAIAPRNMRPSFQGWMRYELHVEPWVIEKLMGHVSEGVTGTNYDRPLTQQLADLVAEKWEEKGKKAVLMEVA